MSNRPLRISMISGSFEYDSEASLTIFRDYMEKNHDVETTLIVYKSEDDNQSLSSLEDADVTVLFTRRLNTVGNELERFKAYCAAGKPLVGIRTASHAYQNWLALDKEVLGGDYQGHYGGGPLTRVEIEPHAKEHPILHSLQNFDAYGSLYKNPDIAPDTTLLLTGKTDEHSEPVAWTRIHNGGRIFYTSLGHQKDFSVDAFLQLLANAVFWTAGRV